jgi:hypothetical protein
MKTLRAAQELRALIDGKFYCPTIRPAVLIGWILIVPCPICVDLRNLRTDSVRVLLA